MEVCKQNELSFYLGLLQEEAAEVIQIVNKNKRFGLNDHHPEESWTNKDRLQMKMKDLITVASILERDFGFDLGISKKDKDFEMRKEAKINKFKNYTKSLGLL